MGCLVRLRLGLSPLSSSRTGSESDWFTFTDMTPQRGRKHCIYLSSLTECELSSVNIFLRHWDVTQRRRTVDITELFMEWNSERTFKQQTDVLFFYYLLTFYNPVVII